MSVIYRTATFLMALDWQLGTAEIKRQTTLVHCTLKIHGTASLQKVHPKKEFINMCQLHLHIQNVQETKMQLLKCKYPNVIINRNTQALVFFKWPHMDSL